QRNTGGKNNEDAQANFMVRGYVQLLAEQGVERAFWYTMHDDRDSSFGLYRFGGGYGDYSAPKPSYNAFATMTRELANARFWSAVDLSSDGRVVEGWEGANNWVQAGPANGALARNADRLKDGGHAGRYEYRFGSGENDYVAFRPPSPLELGQPGAVGLWVYGDNSGHLMQIQLEDQSGELLQFALGKVGGAEWSWMQASLGGEVLPGNRLGGGNNNGRLDGNVKVRALVVDDQPNEYVGSGTIWVDNLTALNGPEAYDFRWQRGDAAIDVVFAPAGANIRIPTASATARVVDRDGAVSELRASDGYLTLWADGRPRYVHHTPRVPQTPIEPPPGPSPPRDSFVPAPSDSAFSDVWNRSDAAVANGQASRSWLWGPTTFATGRENYAETPGGRVVQYWDKSRMEITNPSGNRSELWFVTNGLLTKELISGRLQLGNSSFVERAPAEVPIAGDPANNTGPTYASFGALASLNGDRGVPAAVGAMVTARINRGGEITNDEAMRRYDVRIGSHDPNLQHNIPTVFGEYFRTLPLDWVFVMGYPITEPYWTTVRVGGVEKDVLVQVFERRALTYTPSNAAAFRVEMGNVGQHYFRWRYGTAPWQQ
ncbi:MAG: D-alanyl-D-alanine carboxypeptidase, partial [uncultured Chloroflexia bacterium]